MLWCCLYVKFAYELQGFYALLKLKSYVDCLLQFAPMVLSATESAVVSLHIADIGNSHHTEEMSSEEEMIVLDLVGGLMVIREIVNHLGDFINPYLKQILGIVLNSKVLQ